MPLWLFAQVKGYAVKLATSVFFTLIAAPALADPGHLADMGHNHWVAGAAIGLAIVLGIWGHLKGNSKKAPGSSLERPREISMISGKTWSA